MFIYILIAICLPNVAYAYLDPFSGSLIIQGLIAAFFATVYFFKRKWQQVKTFFGMSDKKDSLDSAIDQDKEDTNKEDTDKEDTEERK